TDYIAQGITQLASANHNLTQLGVAQFLKNSADFNFLKTNIDAYINKNGATAFQNVPAAQQKAVTNELKTYQRIARVSTDFQAITALRQEGFTSAYSIAMTPKPAFLRKCGNQLGGASQASATYTGAQHIMASALNLYANVHTALKGVSFMVTGDVAKQTQAALDAAGIPNWQTLFGSLSYCSCKDCRSVLSAAAYFVDLLQFLRNSTPNSASQTPLDVLLTRRPDLPYIKLNCENTNTPLPYVDLVNEILETFVVESAPANTHTLDKAASHDTPS